MAAAPDDADLRHHESPFLPATFVGCLAANDGTVPPWRDLVGVAPPLRLRTIAPWQFPFIPHYMMGRAGAGGGGNCSRQDCPRRRTDYHQPETLPPKGHRRPSGRGRPLDERRHQHLSRRYRPGSPQRRVSADALRRQGRCLLPSPRKEREVERMEQQTEKLPAAADSHGSANTNRPNPMRRQGHAAANKAPLYIFCSPHANAPVNKSPRNPLRKSCRHLCDLK